MNLIATLALTSALHSSTPAALPLHPEQGKRYCVVAGCILPKYDFLNYTLVDAKLMDSRLGLGESERVLLTSDSANAGLKPTKANLLNAIKEMSSKCGPNDTFWFYWSGHGISYGDTSYILNYDCNPEDYRTMISVTELRKMVSECKARAKVIILDSCHSGSTKAFGSKTWEQLLNGYEGSVTMAAAKIDQTAIESAELGHGFFTYFLVRGLAGAAAGNDGVVTLTELEGYVTSNVKRFAEKVPGRHQDPVFYYEKGQGSQPISQGTPADANSLPVPENPTIEERKPLSPGVVLLIKSPSAELMASVHSKMRAKLIHDHFPTVSDEQSMAFEQVLSAQNVSADTLARWRSRYLLRGSMQVDTAALTGEFRGLFDAHVTLTVELIDADGNVAETFNSNTNGKAVRGADTSALGATEKALTAAVEVVYGRLRSKIEPRFAK